MLLGHWHHVDRPATGLAAHIHGRELLVEPEPAPCAWHWAVRSPHGVVLAEGEAPSCELAEEAAEDEALAVHPPTDLLLDLLLS
jgi:hypothetical protein